MPIALTPAVTMDGSELPVAWQAGLLEIRVERAFQVPGRVTLRFADPGYVLALATVNHFLHAWQTGDIENGMVQLSNGLRRVQDADKVEQFFYDADADVKDRAFEIARGHGQPGRYSFPVVLIEIRGPRITRKVSELIVVETGKNDWVVDKLP